MRLIELRLKNLNSLKGEWHIDFSDAAFLNEGLFAITGQTGAGKTTILDAICLALYGQTPRLGDITGSTNEIMTQGTGECAAEVIIEIGRKRYRCSWYQHRAYKKAKGNLLPIKHEISAVDTGKILEEKKSKTAAYIQDLIGMDFNQFTRSIMLAQGGFAAFLKSDSANRAAILEKITGTDIYAKISLNVHEKKRGEEEVLGKLQAAVNSLSLLSAEEERQLAADVAALNQEQHTQRQTFKTLTEQLKWLDSVRDLQQKLSSYQTEFAAAKQVQQAFIPQAKRLEAGNKALEIDSPFRTLSYSRDTVKQLGREQNDLLNKLPSNLKTLAQASAHLSNAHALEKQAAAQLQTTLPLIAKVRELDADIKQRAHALIENKQRQDTLAANRQQLRQQINGHQQTEQDTRLQLARMAQYFEQHHELNDLDTDMATFDSSCARLKALLQDNVNLFNTKVADDRQSSQLHINVDKLCQQQLAAKRLITQRRAQLTGLQHQQAAVIEGQSLAHIRAEQAQIDQIGNQIEHASSKLQQLSECAAQIQKINLTLPTLQQAVTTLESLIADNESDIQAAKLKRQDKQEHLHLLQKVATLEDYIAALEDGTPCPLCGAHKHPYADHHPFRDNNGQNQLSQTQHTQQQIAELDAGIGNLEQTLSKARIEQATKQQTLNNQQEQLAPLHHHFTTLCRDIQGSISSLLDPIDSYSESITAIINPLAQIKEDIDTFNTFNDTFNQPLDTAAGRLDHALSLLNNAKQNLTEQRETLKAKLSQYDDLTETLSTLSTAIDTDDKQQQVLAHEINNLTTALQLNAQKIEGIAHQIAANFSELAPIITSVSSVVNKYPTAHHEGHLSCTFDATATLGAIDMQDSLKQLVNNSHNQTVLHSADCARHIDRLRQQRGTLTQLKQQFSDHKTSQQQLTNTLSSLTAQIETKQSQLAGDEAALKNLESLITDKNKAIEQLSKDRKRIFADNHTDNEETLLRTAVDKAKTAQASAQRQLDNAEQVVAQLQAVQQQLTTALQSAATTLSVQEGSFAALLVESQFADEGAFVTARLPKEAREALHVRKLAIDNALQHAKLQLSATQQSLEQKLAAPLAALSDNNRDVLASQQQHIQTDIDQLSQQIGALDQKLKDNDNQKGAQAAQLTAINAQKEKLQVWQQLHALIGSADGKKYRTFAQGLTFEVMISHANTQLQKMSDRYLLIHDEDSPLELNVIDNYQGGDIRSTKNLSGGEGFIISLALALGLSQMASHNIRVDSLFLDEGFGTLDEESLDIALDTLTSLQQEGKLIGIISHVQALKERIMTQIKVEKLSGGFSQITGQGCYKVAS